MRNVVMMLAVCVIGWPQLAVADETSRRAMAQELMEVMGLEKQVSEQFDLMREMQKAQLEHLTKMQPGREASDDADRIMDRMMDMLSEALSWDALKDEYTTIYAETFTEDELRGTIEFYKSPIGRKWVEKTPELTKKAMEIAQQRTQELTPRMLEILKEEQQRIKEEAAAAASEADKQVQE